MSTVNRQSEAREQSTDETLQPFHGLFVPGIRFESGHSVWLLDFETTPTPLGGYCEVWLVTPDGERILFVESETVGREVSQYHDFDRISTANIDRTWTGRDDLHLVVDTADGTELALDVELTATPRSRMVGAMSRLTPTPVARSDFGLWMTNQSLDKVLGLGGLKAAGRTETGKRYHGEPERIALVKDATATLNGDDLGSVVAPPESIAFGDIHLTNRPVFFFGDLNMEYAAN